ncbi:hypothetical protein [Glaciecola petra]|uniref:Lipoprotein n=1 Tax=Glaciecola petra TaxID=3075602 RepID=A0ABU2ZLR5_9ALTE|nr:hypothetical protein [Aestuariibacter sp. P117]MDT0593346.1 hypothetical protein [Aestuariibacter sp. P117]
MNSVFLRNYSAIKPLTLVLLTLLSCGLQANDKSKEIDMAYSRLIVALPENSQIIASPYPENLGTYGDGVSSQTALDPNMIGGQILLVYAPKKRNAYDAGVILPISPAVKKGDALYLTFFAKALTPPKGQNTIRIEGVGVQQSIEPYGSIFTNTITLNDKLQSFSFAGIATKNYKAGELQVSFHVGTGKQEIAFGPVFIFNVGQNATVSELPYIDQ